MPIKPLDDPNYSKALTLAAAIFISLAASNFGFAQANSAPSAGRTPVLLITVDTLRWDRLGCYGSRSVRTPAMDALAAQGTRFENALAQVPITFPSHTVILSGTYPMYNGTRHYTSPHLLPNIGLLPEAFARHGYDTAAFVSSFVLHSSFGLNRGFQVYDDQFGPPQSSMGMPSQEVERRADETVGRVLAWFQKRNPHDTGVKPFFVWLHLYDPHYPYNPPEPYHAQYAGRLYDGEVAFADSQLGRLFDYLRKNGLYDRTLIVLLADHGESLGEHGEDEHGFFIYNSTLHVPLIFKLPSAAPRVVHRLVGTIDVAPTILDLVHLADPLSRQFQGASLASEVLGKASASSRPVYSETYYARDSFGWSELTCLSSDRYKYIQAPRAELYDLTQDPQELHSLYSERTALAGALREQLTDLERRYSSSQAAPAGPPLPAETVEKLRSLGYFAFSAPVQPASSGPLPDPKDRLKVYTAVQHARSLTTSGRTAEANGVLEKLASGDPHFYLIPFLQAENFAQAHRWDDAEKMYIACLKLNPDFEQAIMGLAYLNLRDETTAEKAKPWLDLAVHKDPHNFFAYYGLGVIARWEKNNDEAYRCFLKSVQENPNYANSQQELGIALVDLNRFAESLGPLSRAENLGAEDPRLEHYYGTALANVGRSREAVGHYQKALKMKPDFAEARLSLALTYLNLNDRADATREFHTLCGQNSSLCEQFRNQFR